MGFIDRTPQGCAQAVIPTPDLCSWTGMLPQDPRLTYSQEMRILVSKSECQGMQDAAL